MKTLNELIAEVNAVRARGLQVGFSCGTFDILHLGHLRYLQAARERCDFLIVAVNNDASVARLKGSVHPTIPLAERAALVEGMTCVDAVCELTDDRPAALIAALKPKFYFKGGDYDVASLRSATQMHEWGGEAVVLPVCVDQSSSRIKAQIAHDAQHTELPAPPLVPAPGLLLDRDGTLIVNEPYLDDPAKVELLPGVVDALKVACSAGFRLAIITNQQGIALGYLSRRRYLAVNARLLSLLGAAGILIHRIYTCPHSHAISCACRKPGSALVEAAIADLALDPSSSVMIGDRQDDIEAAKAAGIQAKLANDDTWSWLRGLSGSESRDQVPREDR